MISTLSETTSLKMTPHLIKTKNAVQEDDGEQSKTQQDLFNYGEVLTDSQEYAHAQSAIFSGIRTIPSPHAHNNPKTNSESPASLPHPGTYDIHNNIWDNNIWAANSSHQPHHWQCVANIVHIHGISTLVATRVYIPQCTVQCPQTLGFGSAIQMLSESAYSFIHNDCTRVESQQLLARLSSWAVAFLPIMDDGEMKSTLKLLSFLGTHVSLSSGASGLLSGWSCQRWLIYGGDGFRWAQSAEILVEIDHGKEVN